MSANADALRSAEFVGSAGQESPPLEVEVCGADVWNPEDFAREQIRGLVQRVFFPSGGRPITQVVFSAAEPHTDVAGLCDQVGQALALETSAHIAVLGREVCTGAMAGETLGVGRTAIKSWATQKAVNLWRVPGFGLRECGEESGTGRYWLSCLTELRSEFEYAVIHGPAAGISNEAALLGWCWERIARGERPRARLRKNWKRRSLEFWERC